MQKTPYIKTLKFDFTGQSSQSLTLSLPDIRPFLVNKLTANAIAGNAIATPAALVKLRNGSKDINDAFCPLPSMFGDAKMPHDIQIMIQNSNSVSVDLNYLGSTACTIYLTFIGELIG